MLYRTGIGDDSQLPTWTAKVLTEEEWNQHHNDRTPISIKGRMVSPNEFVKVPDVAAGYHKDGTPWSVPKYGDLAGHYIHQDVWHLMTMQEQMAKTIPVLSKLITFAKFNKTVANPAGHLRNLWADAFLFAPLAGVSPFNPKNWRLYREALNDLVGDQKSGWHWEATTAGVNDHNYTSAELSNKSAQEALVGLFGNMHDFGNKLSRAMNDALPPKERVRQAGAALGKLG